MNHSNKKLFYWVVFSAALGNYVYGNSVGVLYSGCFAENGSGDATITEISESDLLDQRSLQLATHLSSEYN